MKAPEKNTVKQSSTLERWKLMIFTDLNFSHDSDTISTFWALQSIQLDESFRLLIKFVT